MEAGALIAELQRRRVFRAVVGYGVAAFALLQIIEPIMHGLHWPDAVLSYVVVALAIGFPVVVSLAWVFDLDLKAGRIERTGPAAGLRGVRLAAVLVGIGILAAAPGTVWFVFVHGRPVAGVLVAIGILVAAPGALWFFFVRGRPAPSSNVRSGDVAPSIAVLPFADMSPGKDQEYFSDGIAEEILNALAQVEGLKVTGRTSSFSFKGKNEDLRGIGKALSVTYLLEGSVRRDGSHVRIAAKLLKASDGFNLWSESYDRELKNIFLIEDEVARSIVRALAPRLGEIAGPLARVREAEHNPAAHELFLRGRYFREKFSPDALAKAKVYFRQAIEFDPSDAPGHAALADALTTHYELGWALASEALPEAKREAELALVLDSRLPEGQAALGRVLQNQFDWTGAERAYRRAIELRPDYARAHQSYALRLGWNGRFAEAGAEGERARQIEPLSTAINYTLTFVFYLSRNYQAAVEQGKSARELDPGHPAGHFFLGRIYLATQHYDEAVAEFHDGSMYKHQGPGLLGNALARSGQRSLAERMLKEQEPLHASSKALIHLGLGNTEEALTWLERSFEENDLMVKNFKVDPLFDSIRLEPRFQRLLERAAFK